MLEGDHQWVTTRAQGPRSSAVTRGTVRATNLLGLERRAVHRVARREVGRAAVLGLVRVEARVVGAHARVVVRVGGVRSRSRGRRGLRGGRWAGRRGGDGGGGPVEWSECRQCESSEGGRLETRRRQGGKAHLTAEVTAGLDGAATDEVTGLDDEAAAEVAGAFEVVAGAFEVVAAAELAAAFEVVDEGAGAGLAPAWQ